MSLGKASRYGADRCPLTSSDCPLASDAAPGSGRGRAGPERAERGGAVRSEGPPPIPLTGTARELDTGAGAAFRIGLNLSDSSRVSSAPVAGRPPLLGAGRADVTETRPAFRGGPLPDRGAVDRAMFGPADAMVAAVVMVVAAALIKGSARCDGGGGGLEVLASGGSGRGLCDTQLQYYCIHLQRFDRLAF